MTSVQPFKHPYSGFMLGMLLLLLMSATAFAQDESTAPEAKPKKVSYSNKWRLQFSGGADSDGVVTLKLIPKEGEPIVADTAIKKGTSENRVAKAVVDSLKAQLPKKVYHVERDDGEDVLVKKKRGAENFGIEIVALTVEGVRIRPQKE